MTHGQQQRLNATRRRRSGRTRSRITGTAARPRLAVFRSLRHISAQLVDDVHTVTLCAAHDRELKGVKTRREKADALGKLIAEKAKAKKISVAVFDRRGYQYHGRIRAVAEGARKGGLQL